MTTAEELLSGVMPSPNGSGPRTMEHLLLNPPKAPTRMLEPSLIVEKGITAIAAPTKVGKTNFWLHVAWALTEGKALFGQLDVAGKFPVLMIQLELSQATMHERLAWLTKELDWSKEAQGRFYIECHRAMLLDRRGGPEALIKLIESCAVQPAFVILDSYNAAVAGDPDKSSEARRALHAIRTAQDATGVTFGITSEMRKAPAGQRIRYHLDDLKGSNELAYDVDALLVLRPTDERRRRLAMEFLAMRHAKTDPPEDLVLVRKGLTFELTARKEPEPDQELEKLLRAHISMGGDSSWRGCCAAARRGGFNVRNELLGAIRNRILGRA